MDGDFFPGRQFAHFMPNKMNSMDLDRALEEHLTLYVVEDILSSLYCLKPRRDS